MRTPITALALALTATMAQAQFDQEDDRIMLAGLDVGVGVEADVNTGAVVNDVERTGRAAARSAGRVEAEAEANAEARSAPMRDSFTALDADADGRISADEAHANPQFERVFGAIDSDDDGVVTSWEFRAYTGGNS